MDLNELFSISDDEIISFLEQAGYKIVPVMGDVIMDYGYPEQRVVNQFKYNAAIPITEQTVQDNQGLNECTVVFKKLVRSKILNMLLK